ncbi:Regulator of telomere elongation helicase 1, partial [Boothiomyces sp. JEL0866]
SKNAIIESPTGTGKTLCLLCAILAWKFAYHDWRFHKKTINVQKVHKSVFGALPYQGDRETDLPLPKIYYASRTHSQLSQAVNEIKNTKYKPKTVVLGSREQMCINPTVQSAAVASKSGMCKSMTRQHKCQYYNNVFRNTAKDEIMDIEDLIKYGKEKTICPFYTSKENQNTADIVFLPYNYLIDTQTREAQNIDLTNSILIFDEAHNLESFCEESFSFELTLSDIRQAIIELDHCLIHLRVDNPTEYSVSEYNSLKLKLEIFKTRLSDYNGIQTHSGKFMYELFQSIEIDYSNANSLTLLIESASSVLSNTGYKSKNIVRYGLALVNDALKLMFKVLEKDSKVIEYYRVHIECKDVITAEHFAPVKKFETVLSFWCFSAEVAMTSLQSLGTRTIILASGTLSPLESIPNEMGILFPYKVENSHVIKHTQILVNVLQKGPSGVDLNSSFTKRDSRDYINDLGLSIANIARVTPKGILVFFTSYALLKKTVEAWERVTKGSRNSIIALIEQHKRVYVEPKSKHEFVKVIDKYNKSVKESGAILFAVCRGKASEGIDFSDDYCRAVLICGIPFPALKDPKVELKKKILACKSSKSGDAWYNQQAYRAVNQAIGRVIRHRKDYGAIILLDNRFSNSWIQKSLPIWIRHHIEVVKEYSKLNSNLESFFSNIKRLDFNDPQSFNPDEAPEGNYKQGAGSTYSKDLDPNRYYNPSDPLSFKVSERPMKYKSEFSCDPNYPLAFQQSTKVFGEYNPDDPLSIPTKSTHHAHFEVDKDDPLYILPKKHSQAHRISKDDPLYVSPRKRDCKFVIKDDPLHIDPKSGNNYTFNQRQLDDPLQYQAPSDPLSIPLYAIPRKKHVVIQYQTSDPLSVPKDYLKQVQSQSHPLSIGNACQATVNNENEKAQGNHLQSETKKAEQPSKKPDVAFNFNENMKNYLGRQKYKDFQSNLKKCKVKKEIDLLQFVMRVCKLISEIEPPFDRQDILHRIELLQEFQKFGGEHKNEVKKELHMFKERYGHKVTLQ